MTTEVSEKLYTVPEFLDLDLPGDEEDYELVGGHVVLRPADRFNGQRGRVVGLLAWQLLNYLDTNPIGTAYGRAVCTLGQAAGPNLVQPDVFVVKSEDKIELFDGPVPLVPALAIEVWSPSDNTDTIQDKIDAYKEAGVALIWSVYLRNKYVLVYRADNPNIKLLNVGDKLTGEDVLPGFTMPIRIFFE